MLSAKLRSCTVHRRNTPKHESDKNIDENFLSRIRKMKTKLNLWLSRDLTLYGKSLLAKTLGVSQLVYAASLLSVPNAVIKIVQTQLFSFLWKNKKDKIKIESSCISASGGRGTKFY